MGAYKFTKQKINVEIILQHGPDFKGEVFISEDVYTGEPRLDDFLNRGDDRFFPLKDESDQITLINKEKVIYVRSKDGSPVNPEYLPEPLKVEVTFFNGESMTGLVYLDLPEDSRRVSDFFNQKQRFLPLFQDDGMVIMNVYHVLHVKE